MLSLVYAILGFGIGAFVGRFLAFVSYHLPLALYEEPGAIETEEIVPRALGKPFCWHCGHLHSILEGLPLYDIYCTHCEVAVDKQKGIIEFFTAFLFAATLFFFPLTLETFFVLAVGCFLIVAFFTDYKEMLLPDQVTLPLLWLGLAGSLVPVFVRSQEALLGAILGYTLFWGFNIFYRYFRSLEGMYPGDFKLNAAIGACVGVGGLMQIISVTFAILLIVTVLLYLLKNRRVDSALLFEEVPYGCYSSMTTLVFLYWFLYQTIGINFFGS